MYVREQLGNALVDGLAMKSQAAQVETSSSISAAISLLTAKVGEAEKSLEVLHDRLAPISRPTLGGAGNTEAPGQTPQCEIEERILALVYRVEGLADLARVTNQRLCI